MNSERMAVLCMGLAVAGCGAGAPPRVTVEDSAGITLVTSVAGAWPDSGGWRLSEEPTVVVPSTTDAYQLAMVFAALRRDDGRIVVANGGENRLLFFDTAGRLVGTAGRPGRGPGEFRNLTHVWRLRGDSLLAYDWLGARVSTWRGDTLGRTTALRATDAAQVIARGVFADGALLMARPPTWRPGMYDGLHADSAILLRYSPDGEQGDTLGVFPWREVYGLELDGRPSRADPPFSRYAVHVPVGRGFIVGPARTGELEVYDETGRLRRLIRWPGSPRPVRGEDRAVYHREQIRDGRAYGVSEQEMEQLLAKLEYPEEMPAYSALIVDAEGNLWVDRFEPDPFAPKRWAVLTAEGDYLGEVTTPGGFEILDVGADYVLGRTRDALDQEGIAIHELRKGGLSADR